MADDLHPRIRLHIPFALGDRVADAVTSTMGSWTFIIVQSTVVVLWLCLNTMGWFVWKWDIFPFILLNLVFSTQAAYASPLILMSQNRQATRDRKRDDLESEEVQSLFDNNLLLMQINQQQLEILTLLREDKEHP